MNITWNRTSQPGVLNLQREIVPDEKPSPVPRPVQPWPPKKAPRPPTFPSPTTPGPTPRTIRPITPKETKLS